MPTASSSKRTESRLKAEGPGKNRLLGLLTVGDFRRLRPHLTLIALKHRQSLCRTHEAISFVYFIEEGMASLVSTMADGKNVSVGIVGNEGVIGLPLMLGVNKSPTSAYVQVPGTAFRIRATQFRKELARSSSMKAVMLRYAHALLNQVARSAACNQVHSLEQRYCRWLLKTQDRMQSNEFPLTQETLAIMLGVQRTGVTAVASALRRAGLIRYARGKVTIVDRRGLMRRSCECYANSKFEFDRLLGD